MSTNFLNEIEETLNRQLPLWSSARLIPRGLLLPLDPYLSGTARAAKKVGEVLPVLVPNNTATTSTEIQPLDVKIYLNVNTLFYLKPGFLISLNNEKVIEITKIAGLEITLSEKAGLNLPAGSVVSVYAFPAKILGDFIVPNPPLPRPNVIEIKTSVELMEGDFIDIPSGHGGFNEYEIVTIHAARKSRDPIGAEFPYIWAIEISQVAIPDIPPEIADSIQTLTGIPRNLIDGETIYLRAFPAYFSKQIVAQPRYFHIPTATIGPYLLDRVSGLVNDNPESAPPSESDPVGGNIVDVDEITEIEFLRGDSSLTKTVKLKVGEQFPVWNQNIESEHLVMWDVLRGQLDFAQGFMVMNLDEHGYAEVFTKLVPSIDHTAVDAPIFTINTQSTSEYNVCIELYPNASVTKTAVVSSTDTNFYSDSAVLHLDPSGEAPTAFKISVAGLPGQQVGVHSIISSLPSVAKIRYKILARTVGNYHWASSGLLQKPMWMSAYLTDGYGLRVPLDGGKIMFPQKSPPVQAAISTTLCGDKPREVSSTCASASLVGTYTQINGLNSARQFHTATMLKDGNVLIVGGIDKDGNALRSAELYNVASGKFVPAGDLTGGRYRHSATLLVDGRVLVVGGISDIYYNVVHGSAEIYDPATNMWTVAGWLNEERSGHRSILLSNSKVLVAGGLGISAPTTSCEIWDPITGLFTYTGSLNWYRIADGIQTNFGLETINGNPYVFGTALVMYGPPYNVTAPPDQQYDVNTGVWADVGGDKHLHGDMVNTYPGSDGSIIVVIGGIPTTDQAVGVIDSLTGDYFRIGDRPVQSVHFGSCKLPDGRSFFTGGRWFWDPGHDYFNETFFYNLVSNTISSGNPLPLKLAGHSMTVLSSTSSCGAILIAGGAVPDGVTEYGVPSSISYLYWY